MNSIYFQLKVSCNNSGIWTFLSKLLDSWGSLSRMWKSLFALKFNFPLWVLSSPLVLWCYSNTLSNRFRQSSICVFTLSFQYERPPGGLELEGEGNWNTVEHYGWKVYCDMRTFTLALYTLLFLYQNIACFHIQRIKAKWLLALCISRSKV